MMADDGNAAGHRWFAATLANPAVECLESRQRRKRTRGIGFGLDEMNESIVVEPQRKIAHALRLGGFQFLEYPGDQLRVSVGQLRLCLIPDHGPFHHFLHGFRSEIIACWPIDVWRPRKDSVARKYFWAASFAVSGSSC